MINVPEIGREGKKRNRGRRNGEQRGHGERKGSDRKRCGKKKKTVTGEDWGGV